MDKMQFAVVLVVKGVRGYMSVLTKAQMEEIYRRNCDMVYRVCLMHLKHEQDAFDTVHLSEEKNSRCLTISAINMKRKKISDAESGCGSMSAGHHRTNRWICRRKDSCQLQIHCPISKKPVNIRNLTGGNLSGVTKIFITGIICRYGFSTAKAAVGFMLRK